MLIAHISDLHYAKLSWSPSQFFSKHWIGNLNLLASRKNDYIQEHLEPLPDLFKTLGTELVIISGDLSTTSQHAEFECAAAFIQSIRGKGIEVMAVPGNHDQYTKKAHKNQWFYDYFDRSFSQGNGPIDAFSLKEHGVAAKSLKGGWWVVALDTALATSLFSSRGLFSEAVESKLQELLKLIPDDNRVILVNHFPFFQNDMPRVRLDRGKALEAVIRSCPKIKFYLHGHSHRHTIADLRADGLPIICDSGSAPHREKGTWNLLELAPRGCSIDVFKWKDKWQKERKVEFVW
jgi:3',5'-cyclic AMP phosphodiesterase CpdA